MNKDKRRQIFERLRAADPNPTTELVNETPFELLIVVILSAQATDKGVNKATQRLYPVANTPQSIFDLGVEGLIPYEINAPFWSDSADKERWLAVPDGTTISVGADGDFNFPNGTVLAKHFRLGGELIGSSVV